LLEPEGSGASAIVVENKFGSVVIDKPGYGTEIPDEKSPPSPVRRMQLRTIDNVLRTLRTPGGTGGPARAGRRGTGRNGCRLVDSHRPAA
jgi:hypothetical protein